MARQLVSVITPSFNQGRFIRATIESVLSQDYPEIEYIIMDGGSTDDTAAVVSEYASRVTWISEKDRGQSHAINKGFGIANGNILAWLNSDDVLLPGAVRLAVRALETQPDAGAVYGEGYLIDNAGSITGRFPATEPYNLWKLVYASDYILQQSVFFRRNAIEEVGYLDESLHWGLDWDLLIRIGKRRPLAYIPEYLGCLREYADAKSFSGGRRRFRELVRIMRRHGTMRYPPAYIAYGVSTYERLLCNCIDRIAPRLMARPAKWAKLVLTVCCDTLIIRTLREAQGWYQDGWATSSVRFMLPPGSGKIRIRGCLPETAGQFTKQSLRIECCGGVSPDYEFPTGPFDLTIPLPHGSSGKAETFVLRAARTFVPSKKGGSRDRRRLAYILDAVDWA